MNGLDNELTTRQIALHVRGLNPPAVTLLHLCVEEHVGGMSYRQIYRIRPVNNDAAFVGLIPTATYCLKVYHVPLCRLCPPDSFLHTTLPRKRLAKNLDRLARIGALWELLARTAVAREMGLDAGVPNVYATFYDQNLLAFGTIEEWIGGRPCRLEMDDRLFERMVPQQPVDYLHPHAFANEYTAKRFFLARIERLFKEMGADGLAARYAWTNWTAPRRVVLRSGTPDIYRGLTAIDFEPALGNVAALRTYLERRRDWFGGLYLAAEELISLIEEVSLAKATTPVLPRANPAVGRLLWHWPSAHLPAAWADRCRHLIQRWERQMRITLRLARHPKLREAWLLEKAEDGLQEGSLSEAEAERIRGQSGDPDVQLYLHCLFVHMCMIVVTPLTVTLGGAAYAAAHHLTLAEGIRIVAAWLAVFAVVPLSPGSLARGLYVAWVAARRNMLKRLKIALFVSFWRYVGYLAFPLQMAATFPALSRYMAALWATRAVRAIPYYGARGGRLEHAVFDLFFNLPLSWARRRREQSGFNTSPSGAKQD